MLESLIGYTIALFIFQPFNVLVHEAGHGFFARSFGGNVEKIEIGLGRPLFELGKVQVNQYFFIMGFCHFTIDHRRLHKVKHSLIALGGVIFNAVTILVLIFVKLYTDHHHFLDGYFFGFTGLLIISALIPVTYFNGWDSDGKWFLNIWRNKLYADDEMDDVK